eukprot:2740184-Alexandrium_andersonii.AAC.1
MNYALEQCQALMDGQAAEANSTVLQDALRKFSQCAAPEPYELVASLCHDTAKAAHDRLAATFEVAACEAKAFAEKSWATLMDDVVARMTAGQAALDQHCAPLNLVALKEGLLAPS